MNMDKKKVLEASKALNGLDLATFKIKVVAVNTLEMTRQFMAAVESIPEDKEKDIPDEVGAVFNDLRDEEEAGTLVLPADPNAPEPAAEEGETAEEEAEPETQKKDKKKDKKKADKKAEPKADGEKKKSNLPVREKNKWGHVVGTMSDAIDQMIAKNATKEEIVKKLMADFGREEDKAKSKLNGHLKNFPCSIDAKTGKLKMVEGK